EMTVPTLNAEGGTPMGEAINLALDMVTQQKVRYNDYGTPYYRPWVFCITDGCPTDNYQSAMQRLKQMESDKKVLGYCVGVENFDKSVMGMIFDHSRIFELRNLNFPSLFKFVSSSLAVVRNSGEASGGTVKVDAPADLQKVEISF
ncbi:MAG TPA: hypothetical protein VHV83_09810, partial [Armatimonadota bacterium]|nr:hypothetical protein [Armatimonadota bacterium]